MQQQEKLLLDYVFLANYLLYQDEFSIINFVYDDSHKGQSDEPDKRTAGQPAIYLNRPGEFMYRRRFNR